MADSTDNRSSGDVIQNRLKQQLTDWRQLVVTLHSIFVWQSDVYPIGLTAFVSLIFIIIWYLETSVLTTLSIIGIISSILDYSLPIINHNLFDPSKWSASDESTFNKICSELSDNWSTIITAYNNWQKTKLSNPKMYYAVVLSTLLALSWIGNIIHNLFLTYLMVLFVVLFPGLKHRGIVDKYVSLLMSYVLKLKRN